jgi:hypothetical protein
LCRVNIGLCELVVWIFTGCTKTKAPSDPVNTEPRNEFIIPLPASMIQHKNMLVLWTMLPFLL